MKRREQNTDLNVCCIARLHGLTLCQPNSRDLASKSKKGLDVVQNALDACPFVPIGAVWICTAVSRPLLISLAWFTGHFVLERNECFSFLTWVQVLEIHVCSMKLKLKLK